MKIAISTLKGRAGAAALLMLLCLFVPPAGSASVGDPAPDFSLPTLKDRTVSLGEFKGKVVLLNFWASWCAPCQEELPELQKIYHKFHDRGFELIGINVDKKRANAEKFAKRFALTFPVALDPEASTIEAYLGRAMPMSYLIDREGVVRQLFFGFNRKKLPGMETAIMEALDGTEK
jgi:peroxiredoxin